MDAGHKPGSACTRTAALHFSYVQAPHRSYMHSITVNLGRSNFTKSFLFPFKKCMDMLFSHLSIESCVLFIFWSTSYMENIIVPYLWQILFVLIFSKSYVCLFLDNLVLIFIYKHLKYRLFHLIVLALMKQIYWYMPIRLIKI